MTLARHRWFAFIPAVVVTAGITVVSLWENPQMPEGMRMSDKLMHSLMYVLFAAVWMAPVRRWCSSRIWSYMMVCFSVTAYGALLELLQANCTRTRSGEWLDVLADLVGALIGVSLIGLFYYAKIQRDKKRT